MIITAYDRQNLFDIALLALGGVAGVFDLARRNNIQITATLKDGTPLTYEMEDMVSANVRRAYARQDINPATDMPKAEYMELLYQTGTKRPPVARRYDIETTDEFACIDKLTETLADIAAGRQPQQAPANRQLTRIFSQPFDETFA